MPGNGFYGEALGTIGMEIEGISNDLEYVSTNVVNYLNRNYPEISRVLSVTRDASTEFNASAVRTSLGSIWISKHTKEVYQFFSKDFTAEKRMGYELITLPRTIPELERLIYPLVSTLRTSGDFISDRAAVHYHVGFMNNLRMLKNLLKISLEIDPVLYRLGGMGGTFRGHINNSAYARPLMNSVASFVSGVDRKSQRYAQTINPVAALDAVTLEDFWAAFGVLYRIGGGSHKYHPARYCGINFYSIPQHGTIEYRHFNQSYNPFLLIAIAKLLRGITELAATITKKDIFQFEIVPSNKEISVSDASEIIMKMVGFLRMYDFDDIPSDEEVEEILKVLGESHFVEIPETPVLTHLRDDSNTIPYELVMKGKLKLYSEVLPPHFCDIHNIGYQSIFNGIDLSTEDGEMAIPESSGEMNDEEMYDNEDD